FEGKKPESKVNVSPSSSAQSKKHDDKTKKEAKGKSHVESLTEYRNFSAEFEDFSNNIINEDNAAEMEDITYSDDKDDVGVNIPTCDEDRLELIELTVFLLPKNMIAYLTKSDASEGFNQIIDFLNGSSIKYALTVNPNIYVSCIKQFWTTIDVQKVNDVTRLQALVDKKKVVVTEATIREALHLDDAEGVKCLPNEEIFVELARMGYEKPSTKLTFYKAFFSSQWNLVRNVDSPTKFYMYPHFLQLMIRRVGKGFSGVDTPLFEGMLVVQKVGEGDANEVNVEDFNVAGVATEGVVSAVDDVVHTTVEEASIPSPTPPTPPPQPSQDIPSTSQDAKDVTVEKSADAEDNANVQGRTIDDTITTASTTITAADVPILAATTAVAPTLTATPSRRRKGVVIKDPKESTTTSIIIHSEAKSKDKGKGILVEEPKPLKKQAQIEQDEQYARELEDKLNKNIDWDKVIDHVQRKQKEDKTVKIYQALKRKPQTKAQARKNMMIYLRNVAGFKMDYFKGMTYDDIRPVFEKYFDLNMVFLQKTKERMDEEDSRAIKRLNESQEEKAAKKQKLDEEVEELKRRLQIVPNDDNDVYTETTPLALKVPVVNYEIYNQNNKPCYKIKRADARYTCSNLEKSKKCLWSRKSQELEAVGILWCADNHIYNNTVDFSDREEISTHKVHSGSDAKYVRFKVEEESEVSLELLSFGVDAAEESQGKYAKRLVLPSQDDAVD
nr:hypothetical protein [Tanacetum cinerariifolium]